MDVSPDDLTAEKFLPAPDAPGERIFLSGDMGHMDEKGCITHVGRKDFQVKIRGYRVETPEVESAILEHFKPVETIVVERGAPGEKELVAYMVPGENTPRDVSSIRMGLAERLPEYMVPTRCVFLEKLPRTVTVKVNRRELPEPPSTRPTLDVEFAPPQTPLEKEIAGLWSEVLGMSPVGVNDSFLDLGGHSLKAAQVAARISERHDLQLALPTVLQCATVAELALVVAARMAGGADAAAVDSILSDLENGGGSPARDV